MYACDYLETGFLNVLRGVTFAAPTKVYLALFLNDPGDSGAAGTEISYAGYARMEIAFSEPAASNGGIGIQNLSDITFAAPADPAGTVTHIAIMDSLVGGNMLARSELTESLVIGANEPPVFLAGDVLFYLTGNMSNAFKTKLLNLFRGTSILGISPHFSLWNGSPEETGSELAGDNYARAALTFSAPSERPDARAELSRRLLQPSLDPVGRLDLFGDLLCRNGRRACVLAGAYGGDHDQERLYADDRRRRVEGGIELICLALTASIYPGFLWEVRTTQFILSCFSLKAWNLLPA